MATNESPTQIPKPERPLKILTLDGGGLQAISTLVILDSLLDSIAETNATNIKVSLDSALILPLIRGDC